MRARDPAQVCFWMNGWDGGRRATAEARARRSEATRVHAVIDRGGYRGGTSERASEGERERETRERTGRGRACRDVPGSIDSRRRSASASARARR